MINVSAYLTICLHHPDESMQSMYVKLSETCCKFSHQCSTAAVCMGAWQEGRDQAIDLWQALWLGGDCSSVRELGCTEVGIVARHGNASGGLGSLIKST